MNVVYRYLDIVCKSASGEEVKIYSDDYDECMDEIKIITDVWDSQLDRGWIGDLTCSTGRAYNVQTAEEIEIVSRSTYHDVLLASINVYKVDNGHITWQYRFLKK